MSNVDANIVWNHIQRYHSDKYELSVSDLRKSLAAAKHDVDHAFVVRLLQGFAADKLGRFYTGRRGRPTRIEWNKLPKDLERIPTAHRAPAVSAVPETEEMRLPVRPGVFARIVVPRDLSAAEASHLADTIRQAFATKPVARP